MKYNVGNEIASKMDQIFKSAEHQALFGVKQAQYVKRHNEVDPTSHCDGVLARGECLKCHKTVEVSKADDSCVKEESSDCSMADDSSKEESKEASAYSIALDSLLTASAALDSVGFEKSAAISLKIASLVAEAAKKKEKAKGKSKKEDKSTSKSKKEDSKSKSSKKEDKSKSSKSKEDSKSKSVKKK